MMNKHYLLDRSVVSAVENRPIYTVGARIKPGDSRPASIDPGLLVARRIDLPSNFVSPLLSIIEGNQRRIPTREEVLELVRRETTAIKNFFKRARHDSDYLKENIIDVVMIALGETAREMDTYRAATKDLRHLLANPNGEDRARRLRDQIFELAADHGISETNPLILCGIASVYGNIHARLVLKPSEIDNKEDDYNVIMDLSKIKLMLNMSDPTDASHPQFRLATADKGLNIFSHAFRATRVETRRSGDQAVVSTLLDLPLFINKLPMLSNKKRQKQELVGLLMEKENQRRYDFMSLLR